MNEGSERLEGGDGEGHRNDGGECRSGLTRESEGRDEGPEGEAGSSGDLALCEMKSCIGE